MQCTLRKLTPLSHILRYLFKSHSHPVLILVRPYSNPIQILFKSYSYPIQILFKSYSNPIQILFKSFSDPVQILFRSYSFLIQIPSIYSTPIPSSFNQLIHTQTQIIVAWGSFSGTISLRLAIYTEGRYTFRNWGTLFP